MKIEGPSQSWSKKICEDEKIKERLAREEDSLTKLVFDLQVSADMASKELQAEDGVVATRKQGLRNKPKVPISRIQETLDTMKSCVLEVPNSFDIITTLEYFIQTLKLGVVVMSEKGPLVTLPSISSHIAK